MSHSNLSSSSQPQSSLSTAESLDASIAASPFTPPRHESSLQDLLQQHLRQQQHAAIQRAIEGDAEPLDEHSLLRHDERFTSFNARRLALVDLINPLQSLSDSLEPATETWFTDDAVRLLCYADHRYGIETGITPHQVDIEANADVNAGTSQRSTYTFSFTRSMVAEVSFFKLDSEVVLRLRFHHAPFLSRMQSTESGFFAVRSASPLATDDTRFSRGSSFELCFSSWSKNTDAGLLRKLISPSQTIPISPVPYLPHASKVHRRVIRGWSRGGETIDQIFQRVPFCIRYWIMHLITCEKLCLYDANVTDLIELADLLCSIPIDQVLGLLDRVSLLLTSTPVHAIVGSLKDRVITNAADSSSETTSHTKSSLVIRHVYVTPLNILPQRPFIDAHGRNRILRLYALQNDRFLSVTFVDEHLGSIVGACSNESNIPSRRIQPILRDGLQVAGRRFRFLAYSSSQLRSQAAWFYCEDNDESVASGDSQKQLSIPSIAEIRSSIGDVSSISVAAKQAARLGQAFSTTQSTVRVPLERVKIIPDIIRGGANFTDGCGIISPELAAEVARKLAHLQGASGELVVPTAFQIRFQGAKGIVSVCPSKSSFAVSLLDGADLALRPSMMKFDGSASEPWLEVCSTSTTLRCHLNRALIPVLSAGGIPAERFLELAERATEQLRSVTNVTVLPLLRSYARHHRWIIDLLEGGYSCDEPFLRDVIDGIKQCMLAEMQQRFKIPIPGAVRMVGIADETRLLPAGTVFFQSRVPSMISAVPGCRVAIGRDPFMHAGDIRVLTLHDVPAASPLRQLFDVLVFSVQGDLPESMKMAGGDLDGDQYIVIWQLDLIPTIEHAPMKYDTSAPMHSSAALASNVPVASPSLCNLAPVTAASHSDFWLKFVSSGSSSLSMISNTHACWADISPKGVCSAECVELARLASVAVDFAKTGVPAVLPSRLRRKEWPNWMNLGGKSFRSTSVLGCLYEYLQQATPSVAAATSSNLPLIDRAFLIPGLHDFEVEAMHDYAAYSREVFQLTQEFDITREADLLTACNYATRSKSTQHRSAVDRQSHNFAQLQAKYRRKFWRGIATGSQARLNKAAAWYKVAYSDVGTGRRFLSFAWIAVEPMVAIKQLQVQSAIPTNPSPHPNELELSIGEAECLFRESRFAPSLTKMEAAWRLHRSKVGSSDSISTRIFIGLALCHYSLREYQAAIHWCERILRIPVSDQRAKAQVLFHRALAAVMPENDTALIDHRGPIDLAVKLIQRVIMSKNLLTTNSMDDRVTLEHLQSLPLTRKLRHFDSVRVVSNPRDLDSVWQSVRSISMSSEELVVMYLAASGEYDFERFSWICDLIIIGSVEGITLRSQQSHAIKVCAGTTTIINVAFTHPKGDPKYAAALCSTGMLVNARTGRDMSQQFDNPRIILVRCVFDGDRYSYGGVLIHGVGAEACILHSHFIRLPRQAVEVRQGGFLLMSHSTVEQCEQGVHGYAGARQLVLQSSIIRRCIREGVLAQGVDPNAASRAQQPMDEIWKHKLSTYTAERRVAEQAVAATSGQSTPLDILLDGCLIEDVAGYGLSIDGSIVNATIRRCVFRNANMPDRRADVFLPLVPVSNLLAKGAVNVRVSACHFFHGRHAGIWIATNYAGLVHIRHSCFIGSTKKSIIDEMNNHEACILGDPRLAKMEAMMPPGFIQEYAKSQGMWSRAPVCEGIIVTQEKSNLSDLLPSVDELLLRCPNLNQIRFNAQFIRPNLHTECVRWTRRVLRHDINRIYYAIGNIPGFDVTKTVSTGTIKHLNRIEIFLAETRDIRNIISTATRVMHDRPVSDLQEESKSEATGSGHLSSITIICHDNFPSLLARIILLLALIHDGADTTDVAAIWSNLGLTDKQHKLLHAKLASLSRGEFPAWLCVASSATLVRIRDVIQAWSMCTMSLELATKPRLKYLQHPDILVTAMEASKRALPKSLQIVLEQSVKHKSQSPSELNLMRSVVGYVQSGSLPFDDASICHLNPTMLEGPEMLMNLYFTSSILRAVEFDVDEKGVLINCQSPNYLANRICRILKTQFDATRAMLNLPSTHIGVIDCSIHELSFSIPTFSWWKQDADPEATRSVFESPLGFDVIDFSNLADYDGLASLMQIAEAHLKDEAHACCILHVRKANHIIDMENRNGPTAMVDNLLRQTIGISGEMMTRLFHLRLNSSSFDTSRHSISMFFTRSSATPVPLDQRSSVLRDMGKRFLSPAFHRPKLLASGLLGCGASTILRVLQSTIPTTSTLSTHVDELFATQGGVLHAAELRALSRLQTWNNDAPIEHDLVLLHFKPNVYYYQLSPCTEYVMQLLLTKEALPMTTKDTMVPTANAILGLIDSFSFDPESYEVTCLLTGEDLTNMGPLFITLCAVIDVHHTCEKKFETLSPSECIRNCDVERAFQLPKWSRMNQAKGVMARIRPSWKQLKTEGNAAFFAGRYLEAIDSYSAGLDADGHLLSTLLLHISLCLIETGQASAALAPALAAFALDRSHFTVWLIISEALAALSNQAQYDHAAASFRQTAFRMIGSGAFTHPLAGIAVLYPRMSTVLHDAGTSFSSVIPVDRQSDPTSVILVAISASLSDYTDSTKEPIFSSISSQVIDHDALQLLRMGVNSVEGGRFAEALARFQSAHSLVKLRSVLLSNRAQSSSKLVGSSATKAFDESWLLDAAAAVTIDPTPKARLRLGEALVNQRKFTEAMQVCKAALSSVGVSPTLRSELEDLNRRAKSTAAAIANSPNSSMSSSSPSNSFAADYFAEPEAEAESVAAATHFRAMRDALASLSSKYDVGDEASDMINNLIDVTDYPSEMQAVSAADWPIGLHRDNCHTNLMIAHAKSSMYRVDRITLQTTKSDEFLDFLLNRSKEELHSRLGLVSRARLEWFLKDPPGSVQFARELDQDDSPSHIIPVHSFGNQIVQRHMVSRGTTHVAIGPQHLDLGCLAAATFDTPTGTAPLRFIGFAPNYVSVAKSMLITEMLRSNRPVDSRAVVVEAVLEVWYSASLRNTSLAALRRAATKLLEQPQLEQNLKTILLHWQTSQTSLSVARTQWLRAQHGLAKAPNLQQKVDRVAYCFYALTGDVLPCNATSLGNVTMFDIPSGFGERDLDETIFNQLPLEQLLRRRCNSASTIIDVARDILREQIEILYDRISKSEVTIEFRFGCLRTHRDATIAALRQLQPWTIFWSNTCDYFTPKQFHQIARQVSRKEDTLHYCASLSWTRDVKGTSLFDFGPLEMRKDLIRIMLTYQSHLGDGIGATWPPDFKRYILLPPIDHSNNIANFLLATLHYRVWHQAFFQPERVGGSMLSSQRPAGAVTPTLYSPFSQRLSQLAFTFTYDPTVKLETPPGSSCMRPGCTSRCHF